MPTESFIPMSSAQSNTEQTTKHLYQQERMMWILRTVLFSWSVSSILAARFVCYYPNWSQYRQGDGKFGVNNIDPHLCTHLMYAFAVLDAESYAIKVYDTWADIELGGYSKFADLRVRNPNLKTMISLGGWTDSTDGSNKYSKLVANDSNIATFVNSVVAFLRKYEFDGLDLDWEYPSSPSDKAGFARLIRVLKTAFSSRGYLLSCAVAASTTVITNGYDLAAMNHTLDFINLMTYDMHGTWEMNADHLAPLYKRPWEMDGTADNNIDFVINYFLSNHFPPGKINLGIALYGQVWVLASNVTSPPAPASGRAPAGPVTKQPGILAYSEICSQVLFGGWKVVRDPAGRTGPYAYSPTSPIQWVGYDDPAFAIVKSKYALSKRLGGAMVWDISEDDFHNNCGGGINPVMTAISQTILGFNASNDNEIPPTIYTTTPRFDKEITTKLAINITVISSAVNITKPSAGPIKCNSDGLFTDTASCYSYYHCIGGVAYKMNCPSGTAFNGKVFSCDWAFNVFSCKARPMIDSV